MKMSYNVEYGPTWWECTIEIDHTPETLANIKSMVEFWGWWEKRLEKNDGDYIDTFLQQLAREINYIMAKSNHDLEGVIGEFKDREGWDLMDGTMGIEITAVDKFSFDYEHYEVGEGTPV